MSAATVDGRALAPSLIAALCNADAAHDWRVRIYRTEANLAALEVDQ